MWLITIYSSHGVVTSRYFSNKEEGRSWASMYCVINDETGTWTYTVMPFNFGSKRRKGGL